jgi:outer membrane protein assembly factor BamB
LYGAEVKKSIRIDNNNELFITQRVSGTMQQWGLYNKAAVLVDTATGKTQWQKMPADLQSSVNEAVAADSSILIFGSELKTSLPRISALDRSSGDIRWAITIQGNNTRTQQVLTADKRFIVQGNTDAGKVKLWAVDIDNGKLLWQHSVSGPLNKEGYADYSLIQTGDAILLITDRVSRLEPSSGKVIWQLQPGSMDASKIQALTVGKALMIYDDKQLLSVEPDQGKLLWQYQAKEGDIVAPLSLDGVLYLVERRGDVQKIHRLSSKTHRPQWTASIIAARSPIRLHNNRAYYSTKDKLVVLDLNNKGRVVAQYALPAYLQSADGLADIIAFVADNVIVARENGVVAFDSQSGKQRYSQKVYHGLGYNYAYLDHKLKLRYLARSGNSWDPGALVSGISQANVDMLYRMGTGYDQAAATTMGYNVSGSSMMLAQSTALLGSTLSMSKNFRNMAVSENLDINKQQMQTAIRSQQESVQHGYYVRPFFYKGWGVTVVRLSDGKRADIIHSRPIEPVRMNQDSLPLLMIDPRHQRLLVKGIGLNPADSGTYEKVGFGYDVYQSWPGIPNNWIIPNESLLAYNLDALPFSSNTPYAEHSKRVMAGEKELALREAITASNIEQVRALLQQGADVNAVDSYGWDALIYAAIFDNQDIVKLLIDQGADATYRDPHGWMAYHYTFLTHAMNRSTGIIRDANLKQSGQ